MNSLLNQGSSTAFPKLAGRRAKEGRVDGDGSMLFKSYTAFISKKIYDSGEKTFANVMCTLVDHVLHCR